MFGRLRGFIGRCDHIRALVCTLSSFRSLANMPLCGPKAGMFRHLTAAVHGEFVCGVAAVRAAGKGRPVAWVHTQSDEDWVSAAAATLATKVTRVFVCVGPERLVSVCARTVAAGLCNPTVG